MKKGHYIKAHWHKGAEIMGWSGPYNSKNRATMYALKKTGDYVGKIDFFYKEVK